MIHFNYTCNTYMTFRSPSWRTNARWPKCQNRQIKLIAEFYDTAKTMDLTCLCLQINNTVVFYQSYTRQTYKEIQSRSHVHSKWKVHKIYEVIELRTIHRGLERLGHFEREKERERERDDRERQREREIEREIHSLRQISCERLQVRNVEIIFFIIYFLKTNLES